MTSSRTRRRERAVAVGTVAFVAGILVGAAGLYVWQGSYGIVTEDRTHPVETPAINPKARAEGPRERLAAPRELSSTAPAVLAAGAPATAAAAIADLRRRDLLLPVKGVNAPDLVDTFQSPRQASSEHEALDILAPRGTPVFAVENGTIEKLFTSVRGGLTIYQFDPSRIYAYYYAHLDRYAPGLIEHAPVARGDVIGYVGTTGNAPKNTPHLHFAIFVLTEQKQWWKGTAVDPFNVWR
jgi:murein DD-endopeptidase MepM/ murein hydrolase activator NlpD